LKYTLHFILAYYLLLNALDEGFPGGAVVKNLSANAEDTRGFDPGSGRSPGRGNGNPFQYFLPGEFH